MWGGKDSEAFTSALCLGRCPELSYWYLSKLHKEVCWQLPPCVAWHHAGLISQVISFS